MFRIEHDQPPRVRWLSKDHDENAFRVDGYDCFAYVQSTSSATGDQRIAESFVALRNSLGLELVGQLPANAIETKCFLQYPQSRPSDGPLFKASQMEQKWDIYLNDARLYFCRSWTGQLVYVAEFEGTPSTVSRFWASAERGAVDTDFAARQIDYLIKSHIYQRLVPHPLPVDLPRDPEQVALYSFSVYGNMCCFGTFEETRSWEVTDQRE